MANRTSIGEVWGDLQYIRDHVDCVTFFGGVVAIRKKRPRDVARALPYADQVLQSFNTSPAHLIRLAEYILRYDGPADQAERAVRNAIKLSGPLSETLGPLVEALIRQQKWDDAGELANQAVRLRPADHSAWGWLSHVERHRGRAEDAIAALERASSLNPDVAHYHDQLYHLRYQAGDLRQALRAAKSAARLNPKHALWRRRVEDLERQVNPPAQ
jgi:tetratricopeptide (TPR) repeat protein